MTKDVSTNDTLPTGRVRGRRFSLGLYAVMLFVTAAETILLVAAIAGYIGAAPLALIHFGFISVLTVAVMVADHMDVDTGDAQIFLVATVAGGPMGAVASLLASARRKRKVTADLTEWYNQIAPPQKMAVSLYDRIRDGRSVRRDAVLPRRFDVVLQEGTMREKQALLAFLATNYDPDYDGILKTALNSPDPAFRVQAAAVAANLRSQARQALTRRIKEYRAATGDKDKMLRIESQIRSELKSGFLDESDRRRALEELRGGRMAAQPPAGMTASQRPITVPVERVN